MSIVKQGLPSQSLKPFQVYYLLSIFCSLEHRVYANGVECVLSCLSQCSVSSSYQLSRFPIGLDFLFITFTILLHLLLSWTSSLSISSSAISTSTLSNHVFLGLPTGLLPSTLYSIHFFTQSSSPFLITCPYHLSLPLLMTVVIGSTPTSLLNSSFVLLSFYEIPHIHLIICISALSNFNPTSTSKGLVSLP